MKTQNEDRRENGKRNLKNSSSSSFKSANDDGNNNNDNDGNRVTAIIIISDEGKLIPAGPRTVNGAIIQDMTSDLPPE